MRCYNVKEKTSLFSRMLCCPSNRKATLEFEDFYENKDIKCYKGTKIPFYNSNQITVYNDD